MLMNKKEDGGKERAKMIALCFYHTFRVSFPFHKKNVKGHEMIHELEEKNKNI